LVLEKFKAQGYLVRTKLLVFTNSEHNIDSIS